MYIHGMIPRNFAKLAEAVPIASRPAPQNLPKQESTFH